MKQVIYPKTRTTMKRFKRVPLAGRGDGFTTVEDGISEVFYETTLAIEALHVLARKASRNKSKSAKMGGLSVRVLSVRVLSERRLP